MIPLTPSFLVAAATTLVGGRVPVESCTALVHYVGYWSHYEHGAARSSWPLPRGSCAELARYAKEEGVLSRMPLAGDVFLLWHAPTASFEHAGIVARVCDDGITPGGTCWVDCDTIEGTCERGDAPGAAGMMIDVVCRVRRFYPSRRAGDRFIRWADVDRRWMAGHPFVILLPPTTAADSR
jgi:hypothetical protein